MSENRDVEDGSIAKTISVFEKNKYIHNAFTIQ